jgi:predicted metal-dependent HD superfamily phosphohydrolase
MGSDWLDVLCRELAEVTDRQARLHWPGKTEPDPPYYNYRLEHVRQVERDALRLLENTEADTDIVLASVWIHDRFQPQYADNGHAAIASSWAAANLEDIGFPRQKVETVCYAVAHHSDPPNTIPEPATEARLLWDADKLSKLGALNVVAFLCAAPAFPSEMITFDRMAEFGLREMRAGQALVCSFYFEPSRVWARGRLEAQRQFFEAAAREVGRGDPRAGWLRQGGPS